MVGRRKAGAIGEQRSGQDSMMLGAAPGVFERAACVVDHEGAERATEKERVRQGSKEREISLSSVHFARHGR